MADILSFLAENRQQAVLLAALLLGTAFGVLAQSSRFCLLRALQGWQTTRSHAGLRVFALAMLAALLSSQGMTHGLSIDLDATMYAQRRLSAGMLIGSVAFGAGMSLANACGARSLVLLASGNLRSLLTLFCLALGAAAAMSGVLAPLRLWLDALALPLPAATLPGWLGAAGGLGAGWGRILGIGVAGGALAAYVLCGWRQSRLGWLAAIGIGALVGGGWSITGGLGADDFEPVPLATLTFIAPISDSLLYLQLSTGVSLRFGVAVVAGVLLGAWLSARLRGEFQWQAFSSEGQMRSAIAGGLLMGCGGVLALGCSIGQGLSGFSTLALATFPILAGIVAGGLLASRSNS